MSDDLHNPYRPAREPLIERQIREAMADGRFDDLPHQGRRLPIEDDSAAGDWAQAFRMLRSQGFAPPWIEADKAIRRLLDERDRLVSRARGAGAVGTVRRRAEITRIVDAVNREVAVLNAEAPSPRQHRRPLDLPAELAALEAAERDVRTSQPGDGLTP